MGIGPRDADLARLQRLAQAVEYAALELGQLVEEQHAEMREADLARPHPDAAADQRGHRRRMVRGAERPGANQASRSEEHTSELQSLMRISYAVFSLKKKNTT